MALVPTSDNLIQVDEIVETTYPTTSWLINKDTGDLEYSNDNIALMKQAIEIRLQIERCTYDIFTNKVGMTTTDLPGQNLGFVISSLKRRIEDCLAVDDRVYGISDFEYKIIDMHSIEVLFTVNTVFGNINESMEYSV